MTLKVAICKPEVSSYLFYLKNKYIETINVVQSVERKLSYETENNIFLTGSSKLSSIFRQLYVEAI